ncbi:MAG: metallophosphoesterase, partial [Fibrobacteres bacterium]|nr:metallophosphoesterase [Fibrobacterota bacterium]
IDDKNEVDNFITCFSKLTISCSKFAILGNWEYWSDVNITELKSKLLKIGIVLLINENRIISIKDRIVQIYGVDDYLGGKPDFNGFRLLNNQVNIILAHCPILFDQIINLDEINNLQKVLVLSGHTHGGQITFFGKPLKKPEGSGNYTSGIYKKKNYILNVSRGIGNSVINIRVFSPSTIEVIEI